jgi:polar amino acid transport system substrate-binding protein
MRRRAVPTAPVGIARAEVGPGWQGEGHTRWGSAGRGLDVASPQMDAVVYDAPILQYLTKENHPGAITVLPRRFVDQDYAIAVPQGSPLREQFDRVLESEIRSPRWKELVYRYLGEED